MLDDGLIRSNCPACLEPEVLHLAAIDTPVATVIRCTNCTFCCRVPVGPNPHQEVALEIIGANELGEKQEGDRRLIVHEGEAMDVIPADEREIP